MDLDPMQSVEDAKKEKSEESKSRLNAMIAVTIALLATFLGICKVKDDNICQSMQAAQTDKLDAWSAYNTKTTEEKIFAGEATSFTIQAASLTGPAKEAALAEAKKSEKESKDEGAKKDDWSKKADEAGKTYDSLNYRDDQFDLSDTLCAMAISLMAITALTQKKFLYWFAMVPTFLGFLMGLAGLFQWKIHPDAITNLLSWIPPVLHP